MTKQFALAVIGFGLALGCSQTSFAQGDNVDGGAHPRTGVPTAGEQGANSASGSATGHNRMMAPRNGKEPASTSMHRNKPNKKMKNNTSDQ
ncbi:hypothetical protein GGQ85_001028 [Nitrobacter vulgaris]|nr:hypothetical protein [Nitrobacter vulgaris]